MAGTATPIFPQTVNFGFGKVSAANTATDGTGTVVLILTAGANGSLVPMVQVEHLGTNVASVLRLFANTGAAPSASTMALIGEITLTANTISQIAQSSQFLNIILFPNTGGLKLPAGYRLYASVGTVLAAGVMVTTPGAGDY